jgi:predicted  nucleic acid-binding Zn-ribbon protein
MASGAERPDLAALAELEEVLRHLESELAAWRRRALTAESRVGDYERLTEAGGATSRLKELESANRSLKQRLEQARVRVAGLVDRLRFLEQQSGNGGQQR